MQPQGQPSAEAGSEDDAEHTQFSFSDDLQKSWHDLVKVFTGTIDLIALEGRLAAVSLSWLIALGLFFAVTLISVFVLLMIVLGLWLSAQGFTVVMALLCITIINILLSFIVWVCIRRMSHNLTFEASRQQLFANKGSDTGDAD